MRSEQQFQGLDRTLQRAWIKGAGFTDAELDRPLIGVANTYQDFSPENVHLRMVADAVKAGIRAAGGTPATPASPTSTGPAESPPSNASWARSCISRRGRSAARPSVTWPSSR